MVLLEGLVVAHLGKGHAVETESGIWLCQTLRKLDTVVVGDRVLLRPGGEEGQGRIEHILPRRSVLQRPGRSEQSRPVAANLDTIYAVFASEPECDFLLLDQYLVISENCNIRAELILNKVDLPASEAVRRELELYCRLGYPLHRVSANLGLGLERLKSDMAGQVSMFAGQSGVGKSSLTRALAPAETVRVNSVSATTRHGRHTTTAATLYHLPSGGDLIDSPGVAIFGLAGLSEGQLAWGYREFQPYIVQCRFNDCRHGPDKDCAVRAAAERGDIAASRYQRFLKLKEKLPSARP